MKGGEIGLPKCVTCHVAKPIGHYFLPGHVDAVLAVSDIHESRAGFISGDHYEMEADHFAASLLMPRALFSNAVRRAGDGLAAIETLADLCQTSLTATGIRYTQCSRDPMAIILSTGDRINYCFMSDALKEADGLDWIRKGEPLPKNTATFAFNQDANRVRRADRAENISDLQHWFGGRHSIEITEEVIGLGGYDRTLTVLTAPDFPDPEEIEEEEELLESWEVRFRR